MIIYKFAIADRRNPLLDPTRTLGVEVTDPEIAAACGLGNIDPQHGQHRPPMCGHSHTHHADEPPTHGGECSVPEWPERHALAAIDYAYRMAWSPPDGATFATTRPDVDSIGAMAVLVLNRLSLVEAEQERDLAQRVGLIASRDAFRPARGAPSPPLPTVDQPWPKDDGVGSIDSSWHLAPLAVLCSPNRAQGQIEHPLPLRVALVACWLLWGERPWDSHEPEAARIFEACGVEREWGTDGLDSWTAWSHVLLSATRRAAEEARLDLARALADGRMTVDVPPETFDAPPGAWADEIEDSRTPRPGRIAIVRGVHVGALGVGYSQADIVIAEQRDPRLPAHDGSEEWPERPLRKITIAWREAELIDHNALCAALNEREIGFRALHGIALAHIPGSRLEWITAAREAVGAGWGGPAALLGSPPGGSVLPLDEILATVRQHRNDGAE